MRRENSSPICDYWKQMEREGSGVTVRREQAHRRRTRSRVAGPEGRAPSRVREGSSVEEVTGASSEVQRYVLAPARSCGVEDRGRGSGSTRSLLSTTVCGNRRTDDAVLFPRRTISDRVRRVRLRRVRAIHQRGAQSCYGTRRNLIMNLRIRTGTGTSPFCPGLK